jgi:hypothetical protein
MDVTLLRSRPELLGSLTLLGRATATDLFQDPAQSPAGPREAYWSGILKFDAAKRGGNANGTLDAPELAYALAYGRILEVVFALGDKNRDGKIQQSEASDVLQLFDIEDPDAVAFFFSEAGTQWNGIPNFTPSGPIQPELGPWEFYRRLENILDANLG